MQERQEAGSGRVRLGEANPGHKGAAGELRKRAHLAQLDFPPSGQRYFRNSRREEDWLVLTLGSDLADEEKHGWRRPAWQGGK